MAKRARQVKSSNRSNFKVSNELLAGLLVLAIAISFFDIFAGVGTELTGYSTVENNASAAVTITSVTSINWTTASIDWGSGAVTAPGPAVLDSEAGTTSLGTWTANGTILQLENIGGDDVVLNMTSNSTAGQFIGGSSPTFKWKFAQGEGTSCTSIQDTSYTAVSDGTGKQICAVFYANDTNDLLNMSIELTIPADATSGAKSATITATGVA
ncbi:hypothetical protein HOD83_00090 [Candidatus Woesearchaeota archaeon]|jgi:hypothetical protein|nr:hypothetical protein [Candidatus Woesearchaeota archaeon]MBT4247979.1 hypothetical protein [Candidatus Woesearchaeota archaeon]